MTSLAKNAIRRYQETRENRRPSASANDAIYCILLNYISTAEHQRRQSNHSVQGTRILARALKNEWIAIPMTASTTIVAKNSGISSIAE
jgi:hypothetical protein